MKSRLKEFVVKKEQELGRRIPQKEIVEITGLNPNTVSRWMSPEPISRIEDNVIIPLCRWLGVEIGDIVFIDYNAE